MSGADAARLEAHRETVRRLMKPGAALSPTSAHATVNNTEWFRHGQPTAARALLHAHLIAQALAGRVASTRPTAVVLAGPPGAGKSNALRRLAGSDLDRWLVIDADEFKRALLREAIDDGSYDEVIKPAAVHELEAGGEPFAPLELASLVHEESSYLARDLRGEAIDARIDLVLDTVLSNVDVGLDVARRLDAAGYEIRVVDVETSAEISAARVEARWREVTRDYTAGMDGTGLGGRWVPSEYVRSVFPPELEGRSRCEGNARRLADECPAVLRYDLFRVTDAAAAPVLELSLARPARGRALVEAATARAVRAAERAAPSPGIER